MNWNNNDTKYIIKKIIIYFLIAFAMFIFSTWKAKAETFSFTYNNYYNTGTYITNTNVYSLNMWNSVKTQTANKKGQLTFSIYQAPITSSAEFINSVSVHDSTNSFECSIGNILFYNDNSNSRIISTIICNVEFDSTGMQYIQIHRATSNDSIYMLFSEHMTFSDSDTNNAVISNMNNIYNQIGNEISKIEQFRVRTNEQLVDLYNLINSQESAVVASINSQTTAINNQTTQIQNINDSINNDNVDGAKGDMDDFNNNSAFSDSTGLQAVIELPLNLVNSFTNTCQPISITIPWLDYTGTIPCMSTIYRQHFSGLYSVVALIVNAFFVYRILLKIYEIVHNAKQPDEDKLEVIDL